jgi:hypothetical protein
MGNFEREVTLGADEIMILYLIPPLSDYSGWSRGTIVSA